MMLDDRGMSTVEYAIGLLAAAALAATLLFVLSGGEVAGQQLYGLVPFRVTDPDVHVPGFPHARILGLSGNHGQDGDDEQRGDQRPPLAEDRDDRDDRDDREDHRADHDRRGPVLLLVEDDGVRRDLFRQRRKPLDELVEWRR
ncbi:DUF4244 domain-containing protein [Kibdelosporangium lantanae]|uniref:DUF4244 domain-containing protein n=1 Tax=Kibdelosporangium lantanae TaxID=1497396 RepID=A0ABW3M2I4_9PSEU